ncbi:hypothetical protein ACFL2A_05680 [Thermodesulfobacteriota bacterium]
MKHIIRLISLFFAFLIIATPTYAYAFLDEITIIDMLAMFGVIEIIISLFMAVIIFLAFFIIALKVRKNAMNGIDTDFSNGEIFLHNTAAFSGAVYVMLLPTMLFMSKGTSLAFMLLHIVPVFLIYFLYMKFRGKLSGAMLHGAALYSFLFNSALCLAFFFSCKSGSRPLVLVVPAFFVFSVFSLNILKKIDRMSKNHETMRNDYLIYFAKGSIIAITSSVVLLLIIALFYGWIDS